MSVSGARSLPAFELIAVAVVAFTVSRLPVEAQGAQQTVTDGPSAQAEAQQAVLKKYCVTCHNQRRATAGLTLDTAHLERPAARPDVWEKVIRKLRTRSMPPPGSPRPDDASYNSLATWLEREIDRSATATPNPGRTETFHRLNRAEYENAIRDLLAVEIDTASLLPPDDSSYGFDNIAGVLKLSPTLLDQYLSVARKVASIAVGVGALAPDAETFRVRSDVSQAGRIDGLPLGTRGGMGFRYTFPQDGEYEFKIEVTQTQPPDPHQLEFSIDGEPVRLITLVRVASDNTNRFGDAALTKNADLTFRVPVKAGPRTIVATFFTKPSLVSGGLREPGRRDSGGGPAISSVLVAGPFGANGATDTPSRGRIFTCYPAVPSDERGCATQILKTLVRRAYRRPVTDADLAVLWPFYETGRAEGRFDAGIELAVRRILVSPEFLFRIEQDPPGAPPVYRIRDIELASRVSFFLWSSIPDEELLDLAARGELSQPAVLERQVRRMLADSRSSALARNFAGQWLDLRTLPTVAPDLKLFPHFTGSLREDFQKETELLFEHLLREDRSILELLTANYTFVNERLAKHYGIPDVYGTRFRRVTLTDENRYGLLGHGSFLTVTSHSDRTSVVGRGKWILDHLLAAPPPPPPPNVSASLPESTSTGQVFTLRERLMHHRANPVCAGCHARMDPLGFALENFDASGRWRTHEDYRPLDTTAELPDGTKFDSPAGLRRWLLGFPEQLVTASTEKLLTYALGRGVEYYDEPAVRAIIRRAAGTNYSLSSLITGVVSSVPFQMKRAPTNPQTAGVTRPPTSVARDIPR
jgi:mono/diheme cytochrome c family protein